MADFVCRVEHCPVCRVYAEFAPELEKLNSVTAAVPVPDEDVDDVVVEPARAVIEVEIQEPEIDIVEALADVFGLSAGEWLARALREALLDRALLHDVARAHGWNPEG
jgi:hypothetical protein